MEFDILTIAKNYLKTLKAGKTGKDLAIFFHPDIIQIELPNRLNAKGVTSHLSQILERAEKGKKLLKMQTYEIDNACVCGDTVVMEVRWSGVLATPVTTLCAGDTIRAHFAMFIQFKNGQIIQQRNYSCFEEW